MSDDLAEVSAALQEAVGQRTALEAAEREREAELRAPLEAAVKARETTLATLGERVKALEDEATRLAVVALEHETTVTRAVYSPSPLRWLPYEARASVRWATRALLLVSYLGGATQWPGISSGAFGVLLGVLPLAVVGAWVLGRLHRE